MTYLRKICVRGAVGTLLLFMVAACAIRPAADQAEPVRKTTYLDARPGDVLAVRLEQLRPTQGAIGYDQIYSVLGRWQGDLARQTWPVGSSQRLAYLNRTVGQKFDDYCAVTGQSARAHAFRDEAEVRLARLDDTRTFACKDAPATHIEALKPVVIGRDGNVYLTDGHHSFSALREVADGGARLMVWVRVDANYAAMPSVAAFWQRMVAEGRAWMRDGENRPLSVEQLPTRLGMANASEPGGMQDDAYRSLVYFTRGIAYGNQSLPDFAEFLWADWLRHERAAGRLRPWSDYQIAAPALPAVILTPSVLTPALQPSGSEHSYVALVRDTALHMAALDASTVVAAGYTAAALGRIALKPNAAPDTPTAQARKRLAGLAQAERGRLWFAVNYRTCGPPAAGTCWGW